VIGLDKTEVIRRRGPWRSLDDVELATLTRVAWYNAQRLLAPLGSSRRPSSSRHSMSARQVRLNKRYSRNELSGNPGAVHNT
jgi:hypothetical protein